MRTFVIGRTSDLAALRRGSERRFYGKIEIDPAIRESGGCEVLAALVKGLNRHLNACGCGLASMFVLVKMAGLVLFYGTSRRTMPSIGWQTGTIVFFTLCASAALGKLIGLAHSEWMFQRLLTRLASKINRNQ